MLKMILKGLGGIITIALLLFVIFYLSEFDYLDNSEIVDFIESHQYNGKIVDMQNEVSVRSIDDVIWYYDKHDTINIQYGKLLLKYKTKDFVTAEVQKDMRDIFITVKQHPETHELRLFFQDEELPEYVKK